MGKRLKLKAGDIFTIPLDAARLGLGQVIEPDDVFYMTVLREPVLHEPDLDVVDTTDILLCGWTTDALLFHGRWHFIGNLPVPTGIPRPCYKVARKGEPWISDFHGQLIRPATAREWDQLEYRSSSSPIAYENALKAHHRLEPDKEWYASLRIEHVMAQAEMCSA